jgi:hypothetical protein
MATFPTPFTGLSALFPITTAKRFPVAVFKFTDMTEQRYRESAGLNAFTLQFDAITTAEKDEIVTFFSDSKGSFDATWSITLGVDTFDYMAFASDTIAPVMGIDGVWSLSVNIVQTRKN